MRGQSATATSSPIFPSDLTPLLQAVQAEMGPHPFAAALSFANLEGLLPDYFAMSQAFPYLQAAAPKDMIFDAIADNRDVPLDAELTAVVGAFLYWDELGGHHVTLRDGNRGLPQVLDTRQFHANLLRDDIALILGRPARPNYGRATSRYLARLYQGLSSPLPVRRCAVMVAFEMHADVMIRALWDSVVTTTRIPCERLAYFACHVGGDDPAEAYHTQMTRRLIDELVGDEARERFVDEFRGAYRANVEWCRALVEGSAQPGRADENEPVWHDGGCHCGQVRFQVAAPRHVKAVRCNCSICDMSSYLHLMVPEAHFRLLEGADKLHSYQFNQRIAQHLFCRECGVKSFYRPRSNPDGYSVNVRCLDRAQIYGVSVREFDGQSWEESISGLYAEKTAQ